MHGIPMRAHVVQDSTLTPLRSFSHATASARSSIRMSAGKTRTTTPDSYAATTAALMDGWYARSLRRVLKVGSGNADIVLSGSRIQGVGVHGRHNQHAQGHVIRTCIRVAPVLLSSPLAHGSSTSQTTGKYCRSCGDLYIKPSKWTASPSTIADIPASYHYVS